MCFNVPATTLIVMLHIENSISGILWSTPISRLEASLEIHCVRLELWACSLPKIRVNSVFRWPDPQNYAPQQALILLVGMVVPREN
jgi:hypothetical protein